MMAVPPSNGRLPLLVLMLHSSCNCRCVMCDIWKDRTGTELSEAALQSWRDDLLRLGVERVCLTGGEPLMHSRFAPVCEAIAGAGVAVTLVTTGLLLARHARVVGRCCDEVVVSLDGPPDVHDEIRRTKRAFELLRNGVRALRDESRAARVTARCTVQRANARHLRATVAAAESLGVSAVSFLPVDVSTSSAFGREDASASTLDHLVVTPVELAGLAAEIEALAADRADAFDSGFILESPEKLRRRILGHFEALAGVRDWQAPMCNAPWVSAVVEADGTTRPCFFHPPVGNVLREGGLAKVLTGPAARAFRATLDVERKEVCRRCVCNLNLRPGDTRVSRKEGVRA
jgi:MoaA/NifB/PqqE/SkfB family radical SAM enzyme